MSRSFQIPETMHGVQLTGHGGMDQLVYRDDIPVPEPAPGEVLIRVGAAGVNNTDINTRIAWYAKDETDADAADGAWGGSQLRFPRIQGADVCGTVVALGDGVSADRLGLRVLVEPSMPKPNGASRFEIDYFGSERDGGFAQFTTAPAAFAHAVESDLTDAELASFPCSYSTAENMLTRAGVRDGETVLVTGASGGVGSAAVQLARRRNARVLAVAGAAKRRGVSDLGADKVIPRGGPIAEALGPESVDVVVDLVAGRQWSDLIRVLKTGGRYAVAGAIGGAMVELDVRDLYLKDLSFFGCTVLEPEVFPSLVGYIERREVAPLVSGAFPLSEIAIAQEAFLTKRHLGKLVLIPPS